jgi:hypothetical protein
MVLPAASCVSCSAITAKFEQACMRQLLGPMRIAMGLRTRRPKHRPKTLPVTLVFADGREKVTQAPVELHPLVVVLPELPVAKMLRGEPLDPRGRTTLGFWQYPAEPDFSQMLAHHGAIDCRVDPIKIEIGSFTRWLAKMAHGLAVAQGDKTYIPLASDYILGRFVDPNFLVGTGTLGAELPAVANQDSLLQIDLRRSEPEGFWLAFVRFFPSRSTAPVYHVVLGRDYLS